MDYSVVVVTRNRRDALELSLPLLVGHQFGPAEQALAPHVANHRVPLLQRAQVGQLIGGRDGRQRRRVYSEEQIVGKNGRVRGRR